MTTAHIVLKVVKIKKSSKYEKINIPSAFSGNIIPVNVISLVDGKLLTYSSRKGNVGYIISDGTQTFNFTRHRSRIIDFDIDRDIVKKTIDRDVLDKNFQKKKRTRRK